MLSLAAVSSVSSFCVPEENQNGTKMRYLRSIEYIYSETSSKYNEANFFASRQHFWEERILRRNTHNLVNDDLWFCTYIFSREKQKSHIFIWHVNIMIWKKYENYKRYIIKNIIRNMKIIIGYSKLINYSVNQFAINIVSKQNYNDLINSYQSKRSR